MASEKEDKKEEKINTQEIKILQSENNITTKDNIEKEEQEDNMQITQETVLENAVVMPPEHNKIEQTVIQNNENIINDDEDQIAVIKKNSSYPLSISNKAVQAEFGQMVDEPENQEIIQQDPKSSISKPAPAKIIADYVFLLGRLTTQSITDIEGNTIIPKNTLITANIVLKAFENGKLLELTKYSKS